MSKDVSEISIGTVYNITANIDGTEEDVTFYTTMSNDDSITINIEESSNEDLIGTSFRIYVNETIHETLTGKERGEVVEFNEKIESL